MPYPSGVSAQFGYIVETTAGTRQAPTTFVEFVQESLKRNPQFIRPRPLAGGRALPKRILDAGQAPAGQIALPVYLETIGPLLRAGIGAVSTTGSNPYTHTITPSASTMRPSLTVQIGRPFMSTSSTVDPYDYVGTYVQQWELAQNAGEELMAQFDFVAMREVSDQSLASASFPTVTPLTFMHATITASGGTECVDSFTITGRNTLAVRQQVCPTVPGEQKINPTGVDVYGGSFTRDFRNSDLYDDMVNGTESTLTAVWTSGSHSLTFTGNVRLTDAGGVVSGPDVVKEQVPYEFVSATSDAAAFTCTLINNVSTI